MFKADNITKTFRLYRSPWDRLREMFFRIPSHRLYTALDRVSLQAAPGEILGIIGENGSGKSTLLKILTGVLLPDQGRLDLEGRITGLLELGTGFNPEFTGLRNIYLNATYLNMSREEVEDRLAGIIDFAELGEFIYDPVKTYSSGMLLRLGFATAIHADPACFLVDEALAVGDAYFQHKCLRKLREFRSQGGSIIFVSHDMNAVKGLCDRALLLDAGRKKAEGSPEEVINHYFRLMADKGNKGDIRTLENSRSPYSYGNGKAEIDRVSLRFRDSGGRNLVISGRPCEVVVRLRAIQDLEDLTVGITIRDLYGRDVFGVNTYNLGRPLDAEAGREMEVAFSFREFNLGPGKYTISAALHSGDVHVHDCYHWLDMALTFEVINSADFPFIGVVRLATEVRVEG